MIKYNLKALISEKEFSEGRRITYDEITKSTGISQTTLSKIANQKGYDTAVSKIEKLCLYFKCGPEDLITIVQEDTKKD
jgi:putative transcriptional regulator